MQETKGKLNAVDDLYPLDDTDFQKVNLPPRVLFGIGMEGALVGKRIAVRQRCVFFG